MTYEVCAISDPTLSQGRLVKKSPFVQIDAVSNRWKYPVGGSNSCRVRQNWDGRRVGW